MTALARPMIEATARVEGVQSMLSPEAQTDARVVELWLGRFESPHTRRSYQRAADRFLAHVGGLHVATLDKLQTFAESLTGKPATRAVILASVKSLLTFAHDTGYLAFNVGRAIKLPAIKDTLAEKIITEGDAIRLVELTPRTGWDFRDHVLLRVMYTTGARVSEITALRWRDVKPRDDGRGQVTLFGKGGKTRVVVIEKKLTFRLLMELRGDASDDDPVFKSRKTGGPLDVSSVLRIVKKAAKRAGVNGNVSPHWLRHAHASHALDNHIPVSEVQATLGHASLATTSKYAHARPGRSSGRGLKL